MNHYPSQGVRRRGEQAGVHVSRAIGLKPGEMRDAGQNHSDRDGDEYHAHQDRCYLTGIFNVTALYCGPETVMVMVLSFTTLRGKVTLPDSSETCTA